MQLQITDACQKVKARDLFPLGYVKAPEATGRQSFTSEK